MFVFLKTTREFDIGDRNELTNTLIKTSNEPRRLIAHMLPVNIEFLWIVTIMGDLIDK